MAAYAATVTSLMKRAVKIDEVTGIGMFAGIVDITNYNSTRAEITAITGKFRSIIAVVCEGTSSSGYICSWHVADKSFVARHFDYDAVANGEAIEAPNDDDIGTTSFVAYGLV